ncbi:hypothetical protein [Methanobrevibacter sp.]|uniref:hypothetical protein n=1 Tax=Methanobrevibacter sp. TaxID=66852 RepID=UPI00386BF9CE
MGNPVNFELRELRMSKEHYTRILKEDELIIKGELIDDGRPRLTDNDKKKINAKIEAINEKINELLNITTG